MKENQLFDELAETFILGAMLQWNEAITAVVSSLKDENFFFTKHKKIYNAIVSLFQKSEPVDISTVSNELRNNGDINICGGVSYIAELTSKSPTCANINHYAKIVKEYSMRRKLLSITEKIKSQCTDKTKNIEETINKLGEEVFNISSSEKLNNFCHVKSFLHAAVARIEKRYYSKEKYSGIACGFDELDDYTCGFQPGELIIIGARPSVGKTAMMLSMASNMAVRKKKTVGIFSLEMSSASLVERLISSEARIETSRLNSGTIREADFPKMHDAATRLYNSNLYLNDSANLTITDLRIAAKRMKIEFGVEVIFIDYVTLISPENRSVPRHEQIAEISRFLKILAKELDIPIIVLSQVRRDAEGRRPNLSDIRDSGALEQDADVVMFIHRKKIKNEDDDENFDDNLIVETEIIIAKQRNGPVGIVRLAFLPRFVRFERLELENRES